MNRLGLLDELKACLEEATKDLILPVRQQKGEVEDGERAVRIYKMRTPDDRNAERYVPYIIAQISEAEDVLEIEGNDGRQRPGRVPRSRAKVALIFAVYNRNSEEGSTALLNLMERVRIALLQKVIIGERYKLVLTQDNGLHMAVYPDDTAPYFIGEIETTWETPQVERDIRQWL